MEKKDIRVLALDLDGTLTNDQKVVTPATRAALDAAAAKGVTIVLASGRPTAGIMPLAKELGLDKKGGCILSYNGGAIIDCATGETLYRKQLDAKYVPQLCSFAREQGVAIITYNKQGVVSENPEDEWALKECFTCKLPMQKVENLAAYVDYPICKMLITLDPARRDEDACNPSGVGIGLSLSRALLVAQGAQITASNASPTGGARFDLVFPKVTV